MNTKRTTESAHVYDNETKNCFCQKLNRLSRKCTASCLTPSHRNRSCIKIGLIIIKVILVCLGHHDRSSRGRLRRASTWFPRLRRSCCTASCYGASPLEPLKSSLRAARGCAIRLSLGELSSAASCAAALPEAAPGVVPDG